MKFIFNTYKKSSSGWYNRTGAATNFSTMNGIRGLLQELRRFILTGDTKWK